MNSVAALISGLLVGGYVVIGLFFLRFWRASRDRLFGFFATAFWLLALQRVLLTVWHDQHTTLLYGLRAFSFIVIIYAIVDKNRTANSQK